MSAIRAAGQKSGNNTLFIIAGILLVVLLILIFIVRSSESSIDQLIQSAAPDSSAFANQTLSTPIEAEELIPNEEPKKVEIIQLPDSAIQSSTNASDSAALVPVEKVVEKPKIEEGGDGKMYFYKIRKGDTMYKIAAKFGNKPADVLALNGLETMSLQADKEIKVKVKALHSVADGEGLNAISEKYSVPAKSILIANDLKSDVLSSGLQLIIPLK